MAYIQSNAPYQRRKKSTLQIMIELGISLGIIWILAVVMSFVKLGIKYGLQSIFLMLTSLGTTLVCDVITTVLKNKKDATLKQKIPYDLVHNYSWITAMIFTLCCPVWTSYYVIIIGSIFATVIAKNVFGGFGKNIFRHIDCFFVHLTTEYRHEDVSLCFKKVQIAACSTAPSFREIWKINHLQSVTLKNPFYSLLQTIFMICPVADNCIFIDKARHSVCVARHIALKRWYDNYSGFQQ